MCVVFPPCLAGGAAAAAVHVAATRGAFACYQLTARQVGRKGGRREAEA